MRARGSFLAAVLTAACGSPKGPARAPRASAPAAHTAPSPPASAPAPPASATPKPPPAPPELVREVFAPSGSAPSALFAIEGGLMVVDGLRVGKITGDAIEWIGKAPKRTSSFGDNSIGSVNGRYPDSVGAVVYSSEGRAPAPTYVAVTGKALQYTAAPGGGSGSIFPAIVGDATVLATSAFDIGQHIVSVRGKLARRFTPGLPRCKKDELISPFLPPEDLAALVPLAFESTSAGTLLSIGILCSKHGAAAEIWDKSTGKPTIVPLDAWWKRSPWGAQLLKGAGDTLWASAGPFAPRLRYAEGAFTALPELGLPAELLFTSPTGQLHIYASDQRIYRFDDGAWTAVAHLAESVDWRNLAIDADGTFWGADYKKVYRLRSAPSGPEASEPKACTSWLVYLYEVAGSNPTYTFPTTRKALATFPGAANIGLVEFGHRFQRHLGVTVTSKSEGEAVVAHVKATMKDEDPRLFCYAPKSPRAIPLDAK